MIRAADIYPLSDFQRHATTYVRQINRTKHPIGLRVDGEAEVVVQDVASYQEMIDRLENVELIASLKRAIGEIEGRAGVPLDQAKSQLNECYVA